MLTVSQMQEVEQSAFARGIKAADLMEQAGKVIAEAVQQFFPIPGTGVLYCGKGNNAGDVLVAGRFLARVGWKIFVRPAFSEEEMSELACEQLQHLRKEDFFLGEDDFQHNKQPLILLDGLLGIGAQGEPRGKVQKLIEELNDRRREEGAFVVAADLPSGLDGTTGIPFKACVEADLTVTIGYPKTGLLADTATNHVGRLAVVSLPDLNPTSRIRDSDFSQYTRSHNDPSNRLCVRHTPHDFKNHFETKSSQKLIYSNPRSRVKANKGEEASLITPEVLHALLPPRSFDVHKGMFGRVGIIAGSRGYLGAARLASAAALHAGAGLVALYALPQTYELLATSAPPEVMVQPIHSYHEVLKESLDALAIGPGLGSEHHDEILSVIEKATIPCVVDADALNALASEMSRLLKMQGPRLLTPHPGEMEQLFPCQQRTRATWAADFVKKYPVTLLLKGARTIIAEQKMPLFYNTTGNAGMASGGMGDLLTGVATAFLAAGHQPRDAAMLGAWLCGHAAELAVFQGTVSSESLVASDVVKNLGRAMKNLRARVF